MPRHCYVYLSVLLIFSALMLTGSALLFVLGHGAALHFAQLFAETPAGVLLLGAIGLAVLLDYS